MVVLVISRKAGGLIIYWKTEMGLGAVIRTGDPGEAQLLFHLHVRIQPCSSRQAKGGAFESFVASLVNPLPGKTPESECSRSALSHHHSDTALSPEF